MSFNRLLFEEHLATAARESRPYDRFDALWKAFNVYYESLFRPSDRRNIQEWELIHRAVEFLPSSAYPSILSQSVTRRLAVISPIMEERIWHRLGKAMTGRHERAKRELRAVAAGAPPRVEQIKALTDVLYVVRCNMAHGFKTREGSRDTEVLEACLPALEQIARNLPIHEGRAPGVA